MKEAKYIVSNLYGIDVRECTGCGCIVMPEAQPFHDDFHAALAALSPQPKPKPAYADDAKVEPKAKTDKKIK